MSYFKIPQIICDRIEKAICRFWWGGNAYTRKIHWKKKDHLLRSKQEGGLGFRNLKNFNEALLAKQIWRLHRTPTSLLAKCLKAKYYPHSDILQANLGHNPSYTWRSIFSTKWIVLKGGCWKIGNSSHVHAWRDNWLPFQNGFRPLPRDNGVSRISHVKDVLGDQP